MKRSAILVLALVGVSVPCCARATGLAATEASPFVRPIAPRRELLAQIGGVGAKKPDEEKKDEKKEEKKEEKKDETARAGIDPKRAMLYSLLVPGLGQQIAGRDERARVFYGIEAAIWTSFIAFRLQGDTRKDRYIEFANFAAGIDPSGKDDDYWRTLSQFVRSDPGAGSANELIRREARALYPDDREAQEAYFQEHGYFGGDAWDWQTRENLERYRTLRSRSIDSYDRAEFSIGLAIAHRIVSMIDAARVARRSSTETSRNASGDPEMHGRFGFKLMKDGDDRVPLLTYKLNF